MKISDSKLLKICLFVQYVRCAVIMDISSWNDNSNDKTRMYIIDLILPKHQNPTFRTIEMFEITLNSFRQCLKFHSRISRGLQQIQNYIWRLIFILNHVTRTVHDCEVYYVH